MAIEKDNIVRFVGGSVNYFFKGCLYRATEGEFNGKERLNVDDTFVVIADDDNHHITVPTSMVTQNLSTSSIELEQKEPLQISIPLPTIESIIQELDCIIHPEVSYDRDREKMMQSVIDNNSASAELVKKRLLMGCLPKGQ